MPPPRTSTVPGLFEQALVDVLVRLVRVHRVGVVVVLGAVLLQVGQELEPGIADREVHVLAAVGDAPGGARARRGREDGEVSAAVAPAHHAHLAHDEHLVVADARHLLLQRRRTRCRPGGSSSRPGRAR